MLDTTPAPVRVLCANGQFTALADAAFRAKYAEPRDCEPEAKPKATYYPNGARVGHEPVRTATERVGRPRIHEPKVHPHAGKGKSWNRRQLDVTRILELRAQGKTQT